MHPEENICREMAIHMYLDELDLRAQLGDWDSDLGRTMLESIDTGDHNTAEEVAYKLPDRLRQLTKRLLDQGNLCALKAKCQETSPLSEAFGSVLDGGVSSIYTSPAKSWKINGLSRNTINSEPVIDSSTMRIRKSGFKIVGAGMGPHVYTVGRISNFLLVDRVRLFVVVQVYQLELHEPSTLYRVSTSSSKPAVLPAESIGDYVSFCPWTDRTKLVDRLFLCALFTSSSSFTTHTT